MRRDTILRWTVLGMLVAAVVDPGCTRQRPVPILIDAGHDVSSAEVERVTQAVAAAGRQFGSTGAGPDAVRIGVGSPRSLLRLHRLQPLAIAVATADRPAHITDLVVPSTMVAGTASVVRVRVSEPSGGDDTPPVVHIRDAGTGQRVGVSRRAAPANVDAGGGAGGWVEIDVLPINAGRWSLCVSMAAPAGADADVGCERAEVVVAAPQIRVDIIDARPSWAARFARLALERWHGAAITSSVRIAAGIVVSTRSSTTPRPEMPVDVTIVGGLDALEARDVNRLAAAARDQGRIVMLLADGPVDNPRLRPLWPYAMRSVASAPAPVAMRVGNHAWRVREWLSPPPLATDVAALAYVDASGAVPAVFSRPLGAGRVVLVTALDAWRWRLMDGVAYDEAWQALVLSLVADARQARAAVAWRVPGPLSDEVHVALPARLATGDDPSRGSGQAWLRLADAPATPFVDDSNGGARAAGMVAASLAAARGVVESEPGATSTPVAVGGALALPVTWDDVRRSLAADGATLVDQARLREAVERLPTGQMSEGTRWFLTRQWWFATLVVLGLALEWWWRRLARQA